LARAHLHPSRPSGARRRRSRREGRQRRSGRWRRAAGRERPGRDESSRAAGPPGGSGGAAGRRGAAAAAGHPRFRVLHPHGGTGPGTGSRERRGAGGAEFVEPRRVPERRSGEGRRGRVREDGRRRPLRRVLPARPAARPRVRGGRRGGQARPLHVSRGHGRHAAAVPVDGAPLHRPRDGTDHHGGPRRVPRAPLRGPQPRRGHGVPRGCGAGRRTGLLRGPVQLHPDAARGGRPARMVGERPGAAGDSRRRVVRPERRPRVAVTRNRWLLSGAAALVVTLLVVIVALTFPSSKEDQDAPKQGSAGPTQVPESETLFVPGYEEAPGGFVLSDPADAQGISTSAELTYDEAAPRITSQAGLSFDARELANPMWGSTESNLALTLDELDSPALRFGGNGIDRHVWWTSSDEPAPEWASVTVTPEDLERVAEVAEEVDASVTIALDLGHDDPARAADMA